MQPIKAEVVICGAGIAGIAAAYFLSVRFGVRNVLLVDERAPLSLTSDKSTEAYRNWWPGPDGALVSLMNRSIDLLEELAEKSGNIFGLNRRGYLYATGDPDHIQDWLKAGENAARWGAGLLRIHDGHPVNQAYFPASPEGYTGGLIGADLILDRSLIAKHFPYLTSRVAGVLHVRRAGWLSGQQLGMYLLEQARLQGVQFWRGHLEEVRIYHRAIVGVSIRRDSQLVEVAAPRLVNAAGPFVHEAGRLLGVDIPVTWEKHLKVSMPDPDGVLPRQAPLLIWDDPQYLPWTEAERSWLAGTVDTRWLLDRFPPGVHGRPEGGPGSQTLLILYPYHLDPVEPSPDVEIEAAYPEIALRGLSTMIPGLAGYFERMPRPYVDGGYYTRTQENRLLCGPLPVRGAYILGALSGYGLMAACAAGELLALYLTGGILPDYAAAFSLDRYSDPAYLKLLDDWGPSGQL